MDFLILLIADVVVNAAFGGILGPSSKLPKPIPGSEEWKKQQANLTRLFTVGLVLIGSMLVACRCLRPR